MLIFTRSLRVCLAVDPVDLRKSFENRGHPLKLSISLPLQWVSMISATTQRMRLTRAHRNPASQEGMGLEIRCSSGSNGALPTPWDTIPWAFPGAPLRPGF